MERNSFFASFDPATHLFFIVRRGERGAIPKALSGGFTDPKLAEAAVQDYLNKTPKKSTKPTKKQGDEWNL